MLAKLFKRPSQKQHHPQARVSQADLDPRIVFHYGIPSTASILALDRTQSLLAIGTLDGRIKVIGGDNIEGLLISPEPLAFKYLEFLENQGFLASVSSENEIQVWDLEQKQIAGSLQWECNITAFSVIYGTNYMYIGSEYAMVSMVKYDAEDRKINLLPYYITANFIAEAAGMSLPDNLSVVGVLHQPSSQGNRLLIAYENGLIVLWDALEDQVVLVRGSKDLQVKEETVHNSFEGTRTELTDATSDSKQVEKEISSLCWVCDDGSSLAVGYVDGDIMFWDISTAESTQDHRSKKLANNVAKLELSSDDKRFPVIVLHWSANRLSHHPRGQLFVYGGEGIGSEEVLTVLSVDWSSGIESLKCIGRVDLTLVGSFADMILLPAAGAMENGETLLFTLTNQGQLHVYDKACWSALMSHQKKRTDGTAVQSPTFIPTTEPCMTVAKLALVDRDGKYSSALSKEVSVDKSNAKHTLKKGGAKWPLTGGVPSQLSDAENFHVERLYVAGYQDGSVRLWDATYPTPSLIYAIGPEVKGIRSTGANGTVSALEFCSLTLKLAIGDVCGLVRLYKLIGSSDETELHFVTKTEKEVYTSQQGNGPRCTAVFSILDSPISILQYANFGARLTVGYECGRVAMLDISTSSVLFLTDSVSNSSSPVICLSVKSFSDTNSISQSPKGSESKNSTDPQNGMNPKDSESKTLSDSGNELAIPKDSESKNVADPEHGMRVKDAEFKTLSDSGNGLAIPENSESKNVADPEPGMSVKDPESQTLSDSGNELAIPKDSESKNVTDPEHEDPESKTLSDSENGLAFIMTRNAHVVILDSATGNMIRSWPMHPKMDSTAISMYIIEDGDVLFDLSSAKKDSLDLPQKGVAKHDDVPPNADSGGTQLVVDQDTSTKTAYFLQRSVNMCVLLCCDYTLHLCSLKSLLEGDSNCILKVNLVKPCCWTTIFKKDGKDSGLVILNQTGVFEIRSFPNLEVVRDISLMTILRWNFVINMDKTFCSSDRGQMILVHGCELAFVSLLAYEDDFRISESFPCLHDKVLAAATDVIADLSQRQKQSAAHRILGGIIKGLKTGKTDQNMDPTGNHEKYCANLESLFSNPPFLKPSTDVKDGQEPVVLNLDDIVIDGPITVLPKDPNKKNEKKADKGSEKKKLFEGATSDTKPKMRTAAEIKAKYRETGDVSAAAARARDMLAERGEKLEKLRENTEELSSGAQDFASMAKELAKRMENRKWWHI
ncbi:uncharacterized protein LOC112189069 isoform X1 [Rosa chinensis]|uniref:uncharacterized protein LOC112189069 isoform X1 n=2 Tax=Rosa chinensis TaxID=74649 RepID=UPI000D0979BE|nr:uncharacterized protein LOC112189069 isoform X1 [Rosa chinensis]